MAVIIEMTQEHVNLTVALPLTDRESRQRIVRV